MQARPRVAAPASGHKGTPHSNDDQPQLHKPGPTNEPPITNNRKPASEAASQKAGSEAYTKHKPQQASTHQLPTSTHAHTRAHAHKNDAAKPPSSSPHRHWRTRQDICIPVARALWTAVRGSADRRGTPCPPPAPASAVRADTSVPPGKPALAKPARPQRTFTNTCTPALSPNPRRALRHSCVWDAIPLSPTVMNASTQLHTEILAHSEQKPGECIQ